MFLTFWRQAGFVAEEAIALVTRSGWMSGLVTVTMTVSLLILGGLWQLSDDLYCLSRSIGGKVEIMTFVAPDGNASGLASAIHQLPGVSSTLVITKDSAWQQLQKDMRTTVNFESLIADNPLPDTIRVRISDPDQVEPVAERIRGMKGVEEVNYGRDLLAKLQQIANFVRTAGLFVVAVLLLATMAITGNTIRLTVQTRRREIELMQLVGASSGFIHWPFLLEGMIFGLLGAVVTCAILVPWRGYEISKLQQLFPFVPLQVDVLQTLRLGSYLLLVGVGVGALASLVSVGRHLTAGVARP